MKTILKTSLLLSLLAAGLACSSSTQALELDRRPLIGINTDIDGEKPEVSRVNSQYIEAVQKAGGVPVLIPPLSAEELKSVLPNLDGVLMIGGDDYPPSLYKQEQHEKVSLMKKKRSQFDMLLASAAIAEKNLPFLGICAGCQALNIASGGSLIQDIPSAKPASKVKHSSPEGWQKGFSKHEVELAKSSKLRSIYGSEKIEVVSSHHQCVDSVGKDLELAARSEDGVAEAIEKQGQRFALGVQWHPERDFETNKSLFAEFIKQAAIYNRQKREEIKH